MGGRWEGEVGGGGVVGGGRRGGEVGGGRWEGEGWGEVGGFGPVPNPPVRFRLGAGGSMRYSVKVLLKRP